MIDVTAIIAHLRPTRVAQSFSCQVAMNLRFSFLPVHEALPAAGTLVFGGHNVKWRLAPRSALLVAHRRP